jgi:LemA protein
MALFLWIIIAVIAIIILWLILAYNKLITLRNRIDNSWSQIDVQLKRRANLIPNLVKTVKGYVKHERETFESITKARSALLKAKDVKGKAEAENMLTGALKSLFAVAENYPQLKANENFKMLQEELSGTESKIAYARQFYNDTVLKLNNAVQKFPTNILANMFGFKQKEYFEVKGKEREPVKVEF